MRLVFAVQRVFEARAYSRPSRHSASVADRSQPCVGRPLGLLILIFLPSWWGAAVSPSWINRQMALALSQQTGCRRR
jgi:hypothetical protein